ncbi:MAG TPA: alpha/beta hydrolase [Steroidobacteraceae bacterium]|nr:alpha/beta hydrolase [Steroidobacteraceae bacterium]
MSARPSFGSVILLGLLFGAVSANAQGLPRTLQDARRMERADALPATAFYTAPVSLRGTEPGDLLRKEAFSGYSLPAGATAVRILYHSLDGAGRGVVSSGVVLVPAGSAPPGGWPVIAWAHGTSGVARQCAPSLMKDVYYGDEGLSAMLRAGFAVVATDYHGLGTSGAHQYLDLDAQAHDVIYSVAAARRAVASLGARWVIDGHSQGGATAWRVATLESSLGDPEYLGAVSVSGSGSLGDMMRHLNRSGGGAFYLTYFAYGIHARYPAFQPAAMLTPRALRDYREATTQGCWYVGYVLYANAPKGSVLKADWRANPWIRRYVRAAREGVTRLNKPIFVLAGGGDRTVPIGGARRVVARACRVGSLVDFKTYPGLDHDQTMVQSLPDQLRWIRDRFEDKPPPGNCAAR